ncbi:hypothetical protein [Listeria booriae]|nr:hypothetical protein [Listeria booriae]
MMRSRTVRIPKKELYRLLDTIDHTLDNDGNYEELTDAFEAKLIHVSQILRDYLFIPKKSNKLNLSKWIKKQKQRSLPHYVTIVDFEHSSIKTRLFPTYTDAYIFFKKEKSCILDTVRFKEDIFTNTSTELSTPIYDMKLGTETEGGL